MTQKLNFSKKLSFSKIKYINGNNDPSDNKSEIKLINEKIIALENLFKFPSAIFKILNSKFKDVKLFIKLFFFYHQVWISLASILLNNISVCIQLYILNKIIKQLFIFLLINLN